MLELIETLLQKDDARQQKIHTLREFLQTQALYQVSKSATASRLIFMGGTALRFFYDLPRFSEDLDFEYTAQKDNPFSLDDLLSRLASYLSAQNIETEYTCNEKTNVYKGFLKFPNLLLPLGLDTDPKRKFLIKIEVDINPPLLTDTETFTISKFDHTFPLRKRNLPAMMSGKLSALFNRVYTKGRDYFDVTWYLMHNVTPDYTVLDVLTGIKDRSTLIERLLAQVEKANVQAIVRDAGPYLMRLEDVQILERMPEIVKQYDERQRMK